MRNRQIEVIYSYIDQDSNTLKECKVVFNQAESFIDNYENAVTFMEDLPELLNAPLFITRHVQFT